jgi:CHAD domain-containing protein
MGLVTRYIIENQETLRMLLKQPVDKEMLHRFRVQIKKMKAIWAIHPIGNNIDFKQSFPNISKLYKLAAHVRDLQMILNCLKSLPAFNQYPEFDKILKSGIRKHKKKFVEKLKTRATRFGVYEENRFFISSFKVASAALIRQNRIEYKHQTFYKLSEETGKNPKELHNLRRQCKYLLFQCTAFHNGGNNPVSGLTKESIDHLQGKLGTWHDWWNTRDWLKNQQVDEKKVLLLNPLLSQTTKKEEFLRFDVLKEIKILLHGLKMQAVN